MEDDTDVHVGHPPRPVNPADRLQPTPPVDLSQCDDDGSWRTCD
ncbi:hypothetical protein ACQP1U_09435 [Actinomycetota bacterium]